jgi:hypothetical protein
MGRVCDLVCAEFGRRMGFVDCLLVWGVGFDGDCPRRVGQFDAFVDERSE